MEPEVRGAIGKRLQEARERARMSQEDVKEALGLASRQAVSKWERGDTMPSSDAWEKLGPLLGVSLDWLFYGIKTKPVANGGIMAKLFPGPDKKVFESEFGIPADLDDPSS
jgi:transcriptional regulator with XRE-family HTH domain